MTAFSDETGRKHSLRCSNCGQMYRDFAPEDSAACECDRKQVQQLKAALSASPVAQESVAALRAANTADYLRILALESESAFDKNELKRSAELIDAVTVSLRPAPPRDEKIQKGATMTAVSDETGRETCWLIEQTRHTVYLMADGNYTRDPLKASRFATRGEADAVLRSLNLNAALYKETIVTEHVFLNNAALSATPVAQEPVAIKPLEWASEPPYLVARVFGGHYSIERHEHGIELQGTFIRHLRCASVATAKSAAQFDYEKRIRGALGTPPATPAGVGADEIAQSIVGELVRQRNGGADLIFAIRDDMESLVIRGDVEVLDIATAILALLSRRSGSDQPRPQIESLPANDSAETRLEI